MIKFLVKRTIKNSDDTDNPKVREKYGILGGVLGIICNTILFIIKIVIGALMGNIAIISDAFNNFSDMGSSIVSLISAKLSSKSPDHDHPFGHGRFEYIAALIVSFVIIFVGIQLGITSFQKLIGGESSSTFNWILIIILLISILIKLWMFSYNRYLSKKINSQVLKSASFDSLSDVAVSLAIVLSTIIGHYFCPDFPLDGVFGIIVGIIIVVNGVKLSIETINTLLGKSPDPETIIKIKDILQSDEKVLGIHDLLVHDYGPGRKIASVHAEVDENENIVDIHERIDELEKKVEKVLSIPIVIHMDPISTTSEEVMMLRLSIKEIISSLNKDLTFHDLRITQGEKNVNVIFDLVIPFKFADKKSIYVETIETYLKNIDPKYSCVINIDYE